MNETEKGKLFNISKVRDAIKLLKEYGLINEIKLGNEYKYIIKDENLHHFINAMKNYFKSELNLLIYKWTYFQVPSKDEILRMDAIFGHEKFKKICLATEIKLTKLKKIIRTCINLDQYCELLHEDGIIIQQYRRQRYRIPITNNDHKRDIQRYREYLVKELDGEMKRISICCKDHNEIERFKMEFAPTIEKYAFLQEVVNRICPKVFEPANTELQANISRLEFSRDVATQIFAKEMDAITPLSLETDRRILKHVEYIRKKNGKVVPVLNINKMSDDQQNRET